MRHFLFAFVNNIDFRNKIWFRQANNSRLLGLYTYI